MTALEDKLATLAGSFSAEELAQIDAVAVDAPPAQYPSAVRAKLQAIANDLSSDERVALRSAVDSGDVEGFMIKQPRVKEPGQGPEGGGVASGGPRVGFDLTSIVPDPLGGVKQVASLVDRISNFVP